MRVWLQVVCPLISFDRDVCASLLPPYFSAALDSHAKVAYLFTTKFLRVRNYSATKVTLYDCDVCRADCEMCRYRWQSLCC